MIKNLLMAAILAFSLTTNAADVAKPWYSNIEVKTYAAVEHPNFDAPQLGAGVDIGLKLSAKVSLHVDAMALENDNWGGSTVDRVSLLGQYELLSSANNKLHVYGIAGAGHVFGPNNWLFTAGLGASYDITKNVEVFADGRPYAEFGGEQGISSRFGVGFSF